MSETAKNEILSNKNPMILLIHSGSTDRYWAYIDAIKDETPPSEEIPSYYRDRARDFSTWFRVLRFEEAPRDIQAHCFVASSGASLSNASRHSMSPYFIIDYANE